MQNGTHSHCNITIIYAIMQYHSVYIHKITCSMISSDVLKSCVPFADKTEASRLPANGQRESSAGCSLSVPHLLAHQKETQVISLACIHMC